MVRIAQRIEALRTEVGLSRPAISLALGFPKVAFEKFETGRQTPSKEQQEKMAAYFGVSLFYLRGESNDRTSQDNWMNESTFSVSEEPVRPAPRPVSPKKKLQQAEGQSTMFDAMFSSRQAQDQLRSLLLEVLKSPEGQAVLERAVTTVLARR